MATASLLVTNRRLSTGLVPSLLVLTLLASGAPASASAQVPGRVSGTVTDTATGLPLQGARVTVVGTSLAALTNGAGAYTITNVPVGTHAVLVTLLGYASQSQTDVQVLSGTTTSVVFALQGSGAFLPPSPNDTLPTDSLRMPVPDSATTRYRQAQIRPALLPDQPGARTSLALFDDLELTVEVQRLTRISDTEYRWVATPVDSLGVRRGSAILVVHDGRVTGNIRFNRRLFQIRPQGSDSLHVIVEVDLTAFGPPDTGALRRPEPLTERRPFRPEEVPPPRRLSLALQAPPSSCSDHLILSAGPIPEIRVLVVYSDSVAAAAPFVRDEISLILAETNQALDSSHIRLHITAAHVQQVYAPDTTGHGVTVHADELQDPTDGVLDGVQALRDQYFADVVVLLVENASGGNAFIMENVTPDFAPWAFAAVGRADATSVYAFTHELGHVLGARHEWGTVAEEPLPYSYNHGFVIAGLYQTIMAVGGADTAINYFSNPQVFYEVGATGRPSTAAKPADNRRALANTAAVVASYRLTPVWFVSSGGASPWLERNVDDHPLGEFRFGDFDADGEADVMRADGLGQWLISLGGSAPWKVLNTSTGELMSEVAFGDFNADDTTDVFRADPGAGEWLVSWGGRGPWQSLNGPDPLVFNQPLSELRFGDFDGDDTTDVFRVEIATGDWFVSPGGTGSWTTLDNPLSDLGAPIPLDELAFGDFNANDTTDIFYATGNGEWRAFEIGDASWRTLIGPDPMFAVPPRRLRFADFDGDGKTDVFRADTGLNRWLLSSGGTSPWEVLNTSCFGLDALRFADFDGDGTADVFRTGIRP